LSTAWRLAQSGWRVTVFDKGRVGAEASWAGAGMLSLGGEIEGPSPLSTLAMESRRLYREFIRELEEASGLAIDYQECGALDLAYSREELQNLEARAAAQVAVGISSKLVTPKHISTFWPRVRQDDLVSGRFYPDDALVNPREIIAALEVACGRADVYIVPHCPVLSVNVSGSTAKVFACDDVRTCEVAIIAAGAWSDSIAVDGVPPLPASEPIKGHLIGYDQPAQTCNTIVRHGHAYVLQRATGLLIAGSSVEDVGFDRDIRPDIASDIARHAGYVFPHLLETMPSEIWTGFRPGSNGLQIGAWHSPSLYLAYGHYRNGILLAPATAKRLMAEINANLRTR
jgi:glycine oxidase